MTQEGGNVTDCTWDFVYSEQAEKISSFFSYYNCYAEFLKICQGNFEADVLLFSL